MRMTLSIPDSLALRFQSAFPPRKRSQMVARLLEKALMEEHFNENYVESHKYPKAEFKGEIKNSDKIDFSKVEFKSGQLPTQICVKPLT